MAAEILDHGTRVLTGPGAGFGSDALLLARFARPRAGEAALDLCSGCGIVALCWHDEGHRGPCAAVELDAAASALCAQAVAENGPAAAHITPVCADLRAFCQAGPERGRFDFAACKPPAKPQRPRRAGGHVVQRAGPFVAGGLRCATARRTSRASARRCARRGWNPSGWPLCAAARTPRRGCFCWRRAAAAAPALCWNRTFCSQPGARCTARRTKNAQTAPHKKHAKPAAGNRRGPHSMV